MEQPVPPKPYRLSAECPRDHHGGGVQALTALSDNVLVSGANDGSVCVWVRGADGRTFANAYTSLAEHTNMLRAIQALPPCGLCPEGGFATGCLDKMVRVFSYSPASHAVACVATLAGHQGGVDSLALTSLGQLLSGGRDGQARVWDLATGAALQVLANHENKTVVCGLAGGAIATGSAGRKSDAGLHVDYKLRLWRCTGGSGGVAPSWALERTISDHEQAIQDLDAMPGGEGFLSASNDGTVRVRDAAGAPLERISAPLNAEGAPTAVYRARMLPASMWVAGCCEDNTLRLWCTETLPAPADQLALPGTPWAVVGLGNGDIAVGCTHAASGRVGHVYLFTQDAARAAPEAEVAAFAVDCTPPARGEGGSGGSGGGGGGGGGAQKVHITASYDARLTAPPGDTKVGGYGFFRQADGGIFVCTWNGGGWEDLGTVEGMEGDDAGGGGGGGGGGGFDFSQSVEMELRSGVSKVPLQWNDGDDLDDVAEAFCKLHAVPGGSVAQVRAFMVNTMAQRGLPPGGRKQREAEAAAAAAAAARPPSLAERLGLTLIPSRVYVDTTAVDWKKLLPKLSELNASVAGAGGVPLSAEEEAWLRDAAGTLADTSRYHSSRIAPAALAPLSAKVLPTWPPSHLLPVLDLLRVAFCHPSGAEAAAALPALLPAVWRVAGSAGEGERPVALLAARLLYNMLKSAPGRGALLRALGALTAAASALLRFPHASVALGGSVVLHNLARALSEGAGAGLAAGAPGDFAAVLALAAQALGSSEEDVRLNALLALGTLLCIDAEGARSWSTAAKASGLQATVAGLRSGKTEAAAREVLKVLELE